MLEYEFLRSLFEFLTIPKNNKKNIGLIVIVGKWWTLCAKKC
jgi:hypothetical protein